MKSFNLALPLTVAIVLTVAVSACGKDKPATDTPGATPSETAAATGTQSSAMPSATASAAASPAAITAAAPTPTPSATATPTPSSTPTPVATLAAGNRCGEVETTDWTASLSGGTLSVSGKAHLRTGGWFLSLADRGTAGEGGRKRLVELVAARQGPGTALTAGIRPVAFTKTGAGTPDRVEVRCGPNRILLIRL
jgi:hypothetical protein